MKTKIHHALAILGLSIVAVQSAACITTGDTFEGLEEDTPVSETELELGEFGCATVPSDATASSPPPCGTTAVVSSPSYDHGSSCPDQFVVEFTGSDQAQVVGEGWGEAIPTTERLCVNSYYTIGAYRRYFIAGWLPSGTTRYSGVWDAEAARCRFEPDAGYGYLTLPGGGTAYRLAVQAMGPLVCGQWGCAIVKRKARAALEAECPSHASL
jgi:hypothetical protein